MSGARPSGGSSLPPEVAPGALDDATAAKVEALIEEEEGAQNRFGGLLGAIGTAVAQHVQRRAEHLGIIGVQVVGLLRPEALWFGVAILAGSLLLGRVLAGSLYGIQATDPVTLALVPALLLGVALLSSYLPARRATRVNPMVALRNE